MSKICFISTYILQKKHFQTVKLWDVIFPASEMMVINLSTFLSFMDKFKAQLEAEWRLGLPDFSSKAL